LARKSDPHQQQLDYAAVSGERKNDLIVCLRLHCPGADLWHWTLMHEIFKVAGGVDFRRTFEEIAGLLWCSRQSARRVVRDLVRWGVLSVEEERYVSRGQRSNCYSIDWEGVRLRSNGPGPAVRRPAETRAREAGELGVHPDTPALQAGPGGYQDGPPFKESNAFTHASTPAIKTSSSFPSAAQEPVRPDSRLAGPSGSPTWQEVEEEVFNFRRTGAGGGVDGAAKACAKADKNGATPSFIRELIAFAEAHADRFDHPAGALYWRVLSARPGQRVSEHWVGQSDRQKREQQRAAAQQSHEKQRSQRVASALEWDAEQRKDHAIEQQLGALLDGMREEERDALAARSLPPGPFGMEAYQRHGCSRPGLIRNQMLAQLHREFTGSSSLIRTE